MFLFFWEADEFWWIFCLIVRGAHGTLIAQQNAWTLRTSSLQSVQWIYISLWVICILLCRLGVRWLHLFHVVAVPYQCCRLGIHHNSHGQPPHGMSELLPAESPWSAVCCQILAMTATVTAAAADSLLLPRNHSQLITGIQGIIAVFYKKPSFAGCDDQNSCNSKQQDSDD